MCNWLFRRIAASVTFAGIVSLANYSTYAQPVPASLERVDLISQSVSVGTQSVDTGLVSDSKSYSDVYNILNAVDFKVLTVTDGVGGLVRAEADLLAETNTAPLVSTNVATTQTTLVLKATQASAHPYASMFSTFPSTSATSTYVMQRPAGAMGSGWIQGEIHLECIDVLQNITANDSVELTGGRVTVGPSYVSFWLNPDGTWTYQGVIGEGRRREPVGDIVDGLDHHFFFIHSLGEGHGIDIESQVSYTLISLNANDPGETKSVQLNVAASGSARPYFNIQ